MTVTLRDLAERLDLSVGTVSRALKRDEAIAAATRERVRAAADELGYRPNTAAQALVTGRRRVIGLHVSALRSYYVAMALRFQARLAADGYRSLLCDEASRPEARLDTDGDIFIGARIPDAYLAHAPGELPAAVSLIAHPVIDYVEVDFYRPVREAVETLLASGRRRIAFLGVEGDARARAYRDALAAAGVEPRVIPTAGLARADGRAAVVACADLPDALVCHNDDLAIGAYRGALDRGVRIPDDVAIVGCDGIEDGDFLERPLSTIVQPLDAQGAAAWQALRRRLERPSLPQQRITLAARLALRATTP